MSKRGAGPLLSTVILILIASTVGIIAMNVGRAQLEVSAHCAIDLGLAPAIVEGERQLCFDSGKNEVFFIVENGAQLAIESFELRVIGTEDIFMESLADSFLGKGEALLRTQTYDAARFGEIRQVKLTPTINLYGEAVVCGEQAVVAEEIRNC